MDLERLQREFARNFAERGDIGASVSVWREGREVITLVGGFQDRERTIPWQPETRVLIWSSTKGLAAACLLHACEKRSVELATPVAVWWPEFGVAGKDEITIAEMLSHRAGLSALSQPVSVLDYNAVVHALEHEAPYWPVGEGHGYHPRTFGFLLDELLRRITGGVTLAEYWRKHFAAPRALDLWIGIAPALAEDVAPVFAARRAPAADDPFYRLFSDRSSLTAQAFSSPQGLHSVSSLNEPAHRAMAFPAFGGIGAARDLARFYAGLISSVDGAPPMFGPQALAWASTSLSNGPDRVLQAPTAFSAGFMKDPVGPDGRKQRAIFGPSLSAFGHPGAGGSLAFADPENGIAFAYLMNQMDPGALPGERALELVRALYV